MSIIELKAEPRTVLGKKVKRLRAAGRIPANVFGPGRPSTAIELDARTLRTAMARLSRTALVRLQVAGEDEPRRVMLRGIERKPTTQEVLHLDFYQVPHGARVRVPVPVVFTGESPAVKLSDGAVVRQLDTVEVEAVPGEVPSSFTIDLAQLVTFDAVVTVRDLELPAGVTAITSPDAVIAAVVAGRLRAAEAGREAEAGETAGE